jgi:hypothetical protein
MVSLIHLLAEICYPHVNSKFSSVVHTYQLSHLIYNSFFCNINKRLKQAKTTYIRKKKLLPSNSASLMNQFSQKPGF